MPQSLERAVGKLEEHAIETTRRLDRMEAKIDQLLSLKWKAAGGVTVLGAILGFFIKFFLH